MNFVPSYECESPPVETPAFRQFTGSTPLSAIFHACPEHLKRIQVTHFNSMHSSNHNILTLLLGAHLIEQRNFLLAIYDEFAPDAAAIITFDTIVKRRRLLDFIDKSDAARERVALVYLGVMAGIEYGRLPTEKTGWATGKDNS